MSLSGYDYSYLNADRTQFQVAGHPALLCLPTCHHVTDRGLIGQSVSLVTRALRVNAAQEPGPLLPELWYFVSDGRPISYGWFEGYDVVTKRRIGYIGNQGFRQQPLSSSEQFRVVGIGLQFYPSTVLLTNNDVQAGACSRDTARSPIVYDDSADRQCSGGATE